MSFDRIPNPEPDDVDLELLLLGEPMDDAARARIERARRGPLAAEEADIALAREVFARERRPLPRPAPAWFPRWAVPVAALAAAAVALFLLWPREPGIRAMGTEFPVDLVAVRAGRPANAPLEYRAGDVVTLTATSPSDGWLNVGVVQEDGTATALVAGSSIRARRGRHLELGSGIEIDAYAGREWLVLYVSTRPLSESHWEQTLAGTLPDPSARAGGAWYVREITRSR